MKIIEEFILSNDDIIRLEKAEYIGDYQMMLYFANGETRKVDFKPFLAKSHHPAIVKYLDENMFKTFDIINGNLNWNDYDLIFPLEELYSGKIDVT